MDLLHRFKQKHIDLSIVRNYGCQLAITEKNAGHHKATDRRRFWAFVDDLSHICRYIYWHSSMSFRDTLMVAHQKGFICPRGKCWDLRSVDLVAAYCIFLLACGWGITYLLRLFCLCASGRWMQLMEHSWDRMQSLMLSSASQWASEWLQLRMIVQVDAFACLENSGFLLLRENSDENALEFGAFWGA
jgi:hypothetical protein